MSTVGKIHFACLVVALLDFALLCLWGISFRGQWFDIILCFAPLFTAFIVVVTRFNNLWIAGKIYFIAMPIVNIICLPIYFLATVFPPLTTYDEAGNYEVRAQGGALSAEGMARLIHKEFIFERIVASVWFTVDHETSSGKPVQIVFKTDSVGLIMPVYAKPDTVVFYED